MTSTMTIAQANAKLQALTEATERKDAAVARYNEIVELIYAGRLPATAMQEAFDAMNAAYDAIAAIAAQA